MLLTEFRDSAHIFSSNAAHDLAASPLVPVYPIDGELYLNGSRYKENPDDILVPPVLLEELKFHPTAIPVFHRSMRELGKRKRSGGDTKMWSRREIENGITYIEDPQDVQTHTWYVVEATSRAIRQSQELEMVIPHHWAVLMAASHDIGEGSELGDFPASATPENYWKFHRMLAKTGKTHLLRVENGCIAGINPDPGVREEIEEMWQTLVGSMRSAEEEHAQELLHSIPYQGSQHLISELRQRFEERDTYPEDIVAHFVRTRDISAEFEAHTQRHSWRRAPYSGPPEQVDSMLRRSIDISIYRMMRSAACLAHTMPWPAVETVRELIEEDFRKLYNTDYPDKADAALAMLNQVWHQALTSEVSLQDHLMLKIPTTHCSI